MPDYLKVIRDCCIGAALLLSSVWMLFYVGLLKYVFTNWFDNPPHSSFVESFAARLWPSIQAFQVQHGLLWAIAPPLPIIDLQAPGSWYSWHFVQHNWLFVSWIVLFYGGCVWMGSAMHSLQLLEQVRREEKLEAMRIRRRGSSTAPSAHTLHQEGLRTEISVKAIEGAKWWSLDGVIVGGAIASVIASIISKLLGLS